MKWGSLKQIKNRLSGQWAKGRFLKSIALNESLFPLETLIKGPSAAEMIDNFDAVRNWIKEIESVCERNKLKLLWKEINHRQLGRNSIPQKIIFSDITDLAGFLGKKIELKIFYSGLTMLRNQFPKLVIWAESYPFELISNVSNMEKLVSVLRWRLEHPQPGIYLRQLSQPGVDTKFIESHRKLLGQWLDILLDDNQINKEFSGIGKFEQRYGFLSRPEMVRLRLLDPDLRISNLSDLTVRADEFASLSLSVKYVFIIENDVTALAFPPVKNSLVIFGRGYNFDHLIQASWLNEKELWYWGDLDTHGFAILNQFRSLFPGVNSFLMDSETLMLHELHWGMEKTPTVADLPKLGKEEALLYDKIRYNRIKDNIRLEQEFIDFSWALEVIKMISSKS